MDIQSIIDAIRHNCIRIADHADEEAQTDRLIFNEISLGVLYRSDPERWINWRRRRKK